MYVSRACDVCKRRKVKCDGVEPCANCNTSKLQCSYNIVPRRRGRAVNKRPLDDAESPPASRKSLAKSEPSASPLSNKLRPILAPSVSSVAESPVSALHPHGPSLPVSYGSYSPQLDAIHICTSLVDYFDSLQSGQDICDVAHKCIDLWMACIYPVVPSGHEPTLRAGVSVFVRKGWPTALGPASSLRPDSPQLTFMKHFALVTAICAYVFSTAPASLVPLKDVLSGPFLQASRAMLSSYESYDLEEPDSTSLVIRTWHASAMQNTSGKHGSAFQTHMGAELLALRLRLYEEASVTKFNAQEAQQLRSIFWLLHHSDKASVAFSSRTYILQEESFDGPITLQEYGDMAEAPQLDMTRKYNHPSLDEHIHAAFHKKRRMYMYAANLVKAVRRLPITQATTPQGHVSSPVIEKSGMDVVSQAELGRLAALHQSFTECMRDVKQCFVLPEQPVLDEEKLSPERIQYRQRIRYAIQSNMMTSFHCLELIILQECSSRGLHGTLGLIGPGDPERELAVRKMDIAQDFLYELQSVPFDCFKMQGEPGVQRVRQVGSRMLELVRTATHDVTKARAESQFGQILNYLAQLDSKASDALE